MSGWPTRSQRTQSARSSSRRKIGSERENAGEGNRRVDGGALGSASVDLARHARDLELLVGSVREVRGERRPGSSAGRRPSVYGAAATR